jgi:excisionase family DNA binding protein
LLPRGLPLRAAATYSGLPVRRLWAYIADGRLRAIRPPGCRRVLLDRFDLDRLLEGWKEPGR